MSMFSLIKYITNHPLNNGSRTRAIIRAARWQIGSRLVAAPIVYDWINGSQFLVRTGDTGLTGNIYVGLHEFPDMAYVLHVLGDDDLFIDVGANVGSYTILACAAVGASGYAFEPIPSTYRRLIENIRLNHLENRVKCLNIGLGRTQGRIAFTSALDTTNHALASDEQCDSTISVDVSTLDTILKGELPTMMKIDVEGYETPVLEGALETLGKQTLHSVVMELNGSGSRYGFDESKILEMMLDLGFRAHSYDPLRRTLTSLQGKNQKSGNTLFIRRESFVFEKLKKSPKITVYGKQF